MLKKNLTKQNIVVGICFFVFLIFTSYLALNLKMGISPDSWYHLRVSQEYSKTLGIPTNIPDTYQWRDITNIPYLYFWINARILNINDTTFQFNQIILLRIINILYSSLTLLGVYLLSKELIKDKWGKLIPILLISNTLMFLFLSSSINYDNLANLFSTFAIYFFIKTVKYKGKIHYPLYTILLLCMGALTKFTIVPLAVILVVLLVYEFIKNKDIWRKSIKGSSLFLILPILIFGILNILLYGNNFLKHQELVPSCEKILTHEQCLENGVYLRDNIWIPEVDTKTIHMILNGERLDPIRYSGVWVWEMTKRVVGIMGDQSLFHPNTVVSIFVFLILITVFLGIWERKKINKEGIYLVLITLSYLLILILFQNYPMYLKRGYIELALQGRYMFPVISSLYVMFVIFLLNIQKKYLRISLILVILILMILCSIPFFIVNVNPNWFGLLTAI